MHTIKCDRAIIFRIQSAWFKDDLNRSLLHFGFYFQLEFHFCIIFLRKRSDFNSYLIYERKEAKNCFFAEQSRI